MGLAGHPINLNRFPDGIDGAKGGFYHKAVPTHAPVWVRRWPNPNAGKGETREYLMIDGAPACGVGRELRRVRRLPPLDIDVLRHRTSRRTRWSTSTPVREDSLGRHRDDRRAVPSRDGQARARGPAEGDRQARDPDLDTGGVSGYSFRQTSDFVEALSKYGGRGGERFCELAVAKNDRGGLARLDYTRTRSTRPSSPPTASARRRRAGVRAAGVGRARRCRLRPDRWTIRDVLHRLETSETHSMRSSGRNRSFQSCSGNRYQGSPTEHE